MASPAISKAKEYIGNYEVKKTLGEGSFAKVKLGVHKLTGQKVALKIVDKHHLPDEYSIRNMYREGQILRLLDHPNVIRLFEIMETKKDIILVIEYAAGGELLNYIIAHGRVKEPEAKKFVRQIVDALSYCHSMHVVHRDLKAENFLLDEELNIKITDFGLSNVFDNNKNLETFCGSLVYSAPELIEGTKYVGPEIDIWSLGVNLFALVVGELPFADKKVNVLHDSILNGKFKTPDFLSSECKDLIKGMLCPDPKKRLTLAQINEHEWLKEVPSKTNVKDVVLFHPKNEEDIDEDIIEEMKEMGFDPATLVKNILKENYNQISATYALLAQKKNKDIQKGIAPIVKPRKNSDSRAVQSQKDFTKLEELELANLMKRMEVKKARPRASTVTTNVIEEAPKHSRQNSDKLQSISELSPIMDRAANTKANRPMSASTSLAPPAVIPPPVTTSSQKSLPKSTPGIPTISFAELPKPEKDNAKHPALARLMKTQLARPRSKTVSNTPMPDVAQTLGNLSVPSKASPNGSGNTTPTGSTSPNTSGNSFKRSASSSSGNFDNGIKAVRFAFNLSTTFQLEPEKIMEEIKKSLLINLVNFSLEGYCFHCTQQYKESTVEFELELCKVPRLSLHGIKFRRTRGDIWEYKRCCTRLIQSWDHLKSK